VDSHTPLPIISRGAWYFNCNTHSLDTRERAIGIENVLDQCRFTIGQRRPTLGLGVYALLLELDQACKLGAELLGNRGALSFDDHLADLEGVALLGEWSLQRQQLVENHAERKDVGREAVLLVEQDLGSHVARCADHGVCNGVGRDLLGRVEVTQCQVRNAARAIERQEDVVGLEIAMQELARMQHREAGDNVHREPSNLGC
jgi:hypothetical protein